MSLRSQQQGEKPRARDLWRLDPDVAHLNHRSFGACPQEVLQLQRQFAETMELDPVRFFTRLRQPLLDESRQKLAATIGADPADLAFVANATHGCNAVLRWLRFDPGDEILITNHGYNAVSNAAKCVAAQWRARVTVAQIPVPVRSPSDVVTSNSEYRPRYSIGRRRPDACSASRLRPATVWTTTPDWLPRWARFWDARAVND